MYLELEPPILLVYNLVHNCPQDFSVDKIATG